MDKNLEMYVRHKLPLVPLQEKSKVPWPGLKWKSVASYNEDQIEKWLKQWPKTNWGCALPKNMILIDQDFRPEEGFDGRESFKMLQEQADEPIETWTAITPSKGIHLWFTIKDGEYRQSQNLISRGIDTRVGGKGYALVPPSFVIEEKYQGSYYWDISPDDVEIQELPPWLHELCLLSTDTVQDVPEEGEILNTNEEFSYAVHNLNALNPARADNYQSWIDVGMTLSQLGEMGFYLWENWSKQSPKYKPGDCMQKWITFKPGVGLSLRSLAYWAAEDNPEGLKKVPTAPKVPKPSHYKRAIVASGWQFRMNESNYDVEINGLPITRPVKAVLYNQLREGGYKNTEIMEDCFYELAFRNSFHPVKDYLDGLTWNGEDHITKLAAYFKDEHNVFRTWIRRWLIGAIARPFANGAQNRMLILDGKQNLGKSYFVRWLGSPVPTCYIEGRINPDDKDADIRLIKNWIMEVAELGSTVRRADREALKFFISKEVVTVRKPYDKADTVRPALTSFIGTVNNEAGFLSDPTGSRRFMICTLTDIDWKYATEVDINQVWAQAYVLFRSGEPWDLTPEENELASLINKEYEISNPTLEYLLYYFIIDPDNKETFIPTFRILERLRIVGKLQKLSDRHAMMEISSALKQLGCEKKRKRIDGIQVMGFEGVERRPDVM